MAHVNKFIKGKQLLIAALVLGLLGAAALVPKALDRAQANQYQTTVDRPDVVLQVEGMACSSCAHSMKTQLQKLDAVEEAQVLLDEQKVLLALYDGETVTKEALQEAVTTAGFTFHAATFTKGSAAAEQQDDA